jgi:hypothetical protein
MRRIAPGVYDDEHGGMHIDLPELLAASGYADTPENRDTLTRAAQDLFGRLPGTTVEVTDVPISERVRR